MESVSPAETHSELKGVTFKGIQYKIILIFIFQASDSNVHTILLIL